MKYLDDVLIAVKAKGGKPRVLVVHSDEVDTAMAVWCLINDIRLSQSPYAERGHAYLMEDRAADQLATERRVWRITA